MRLSKNLALAKVFWIITVTALVLIATPIALSFYSSLIVQEERRVETYYVNFPSCRCSLLNFEPEDWVIEKLEEKLNVKVEQHIVSFDMNDKNYTAIMISDYIIGNSTFIHGNTIDVLWKILNNDIQILDKSEVNFIPLATNSSRIDHQEGNLTVTEERYYTNLLANSTLIINYLSVAACNWEVAYASQTYYVPGIVKTEAAGVFYYIRNCKIIKIIGLSNDWHGFFTQHCSYYSKKDGEGTIAGTVEADSYDWISPACLPWPTATKIHLHPRIHVYVFGNTQFTGFYNVSYGWCGC